MNPIFKVNMFHLFFRKDVRPEEEEEEEDARLRAYALVSTVVSFRLSVQTYLPL